ncbi:MAG: hypothetical protein ACR2KQ_08470 [Actinomycetota bacterium]
MRFGIRCAVSILTVVALSVFGLASVGAADGDQSRESIFISSDEHFNPANGVRSGSGTKSDPYVISGWTVDRIHLRDTSAAVVIRDNVITSSLVLNWNGGNVKVVDNEIGDLRVNQNIERTGEPTSGLIARNTIGVVGQIRHFDGVFQKNVVTGERPDGFVALPFFGSGQAVNFDGFHGSRFRDNKINGFVTVRLHGHHHGSGYTKNSHYHGAAKEHESQDDMVDHTQRYHQVFVTGNTITSPGPYALNYVDTAHAANDRTAASETNEALNKPHVHHTKVHMNNNRLIGSGLYVNVFNADDERHLGTRRGHLELKNNRIELVQEGDRGPFSYEEPAGISIHQAKDVHMRITGNTITNEVEANALRDADVPLFVQYETSGIRLYRIEKSEIHIGNNSVASTNYGVFAQHMPASVDWWVHGLALKQVPMDVYWDNTVVNQPSRD